MPRRAIIAAMTCLQQLRQAARLARVVLAWFALAIGVAVAAPMVNPQAMELVCSGSGAMKLVVKGAGDAPDAPAASSSHTLDCPLCATPAGPAPDPLAAWAPPREPLAFALQRDQAAHLRAVTAAPLSARAPPQIS